MLSGVEHEKSFITSGPVHQYCFGDKGRCQIYHKSIMPHVSKVFIFGTMGANAKGGGGTLKFSYIRRLGPFSGVPNFEFQYFWGLSEE